jgi:transport family protein 27
MVLLRCKVLVVGDASVGKTALIQSYLSNGANFPKNYVMTNACAIN